MSTLQTLTCISSPSVFKLLMVNSLYISPVDLGSVMTMGGIENKNKGREKQIIPKLREGKALYSTGRFKKLLFTF